MSAVPRFDVVIVPAKPGFRVGERGVRALLSYLAMSQLAVVDEVVEGDGWTEIYLAPDRFAHHLFSEGDAPKEELVFLEGVLRFGQTHCGVPYGDSGREIFVYLEFCGALYDRPGEAFLERLQQMLYLRPAFHFRSHAPALPRSRSGELDPLASPQVRQPRSRRAGITFEEVDIDVG